MNRRRRDDTPPGPGEVRIRIEATDDPAADRVRAALAELGALADVEVLDRSAPRRRRDGTIRRRHVEGLAHTYLTVHLAPETKESRDGDQ